MNELIKRLRNLKSDRYGTFEQAADELENLINDRDNWQYQALLLENSLADCWLRVQNLHNALKLLRDYTPRENYVGGVENGRYEPVGSALMEVLDIVDAALAMPPLKEED
jgi:hypothetical protein